jgi:RsiW-degrading membrane proteinase PrsW (M82 family)
MLSLETILYALLGGVVPALIWLDFLLHEDRRCPEPKWIVALGFGIGALSALISIPLEHIAKLFVTDHIGLIVTWAFIEEVVKFGLAFAFILWRKEIARSTHLVTSMVTVALGFAAFENTLFLLEPLSQGLVVDFFITGNLRFIGATLLHVVASGAIGLALAFSFKVHKELKLIFISTGVILSTGLHALFNFFILKGDGTYTLFAFFTVWLCVIFFLALFEVLKYFRYKNLPPNKC